MFTRFALIAAAALMASSATADAQGKGKGKGNGNPANVAGNPSTGHCPPGLAKKTPPCVPPGLAKVAPAAGTASGETIEIVETPTVVVVEGAEVVVLQPGEVIVDSYTIVTDPFFYGLDPAHEYYRVGDLFYRVDPETREVLAFVGALNDLLAD